MRLRDLPRLVHAHREARQRKALCQKPDLTYLFWECTLRCNLRCAHCGSSCEGESRVPELTTEQVTRVLDTIAEDFDTSRIFVSITGGEPLLRRDLATVVAHMTRVGLRSCIVTNGTLLNADRARELVDAGMRTVTVSIDGLEDAHDAVRGRGTYRKALSALTEARRAGMTVVEAITCVRPDNVGTLRELERTVRDAGANLYRVITIDRMGRFAADAPERTKVSGPELWLDPKGVRAMLDYVAERRAELERAREDFDVRFSCGGFLGLEHERRVRPESGQCYARLCVASILCNGDVGACPSLPRAWAREGSILEDRFSTIWRERFGRYRDLASRREGLCEHCSWFDVCLGGGLHERLVQPEDFCWLDRVE